MTRLPASSINEIKFSALQIACALASKGISPSTVKSITKVSYDLAESLHREAKYRYESRDD